MVRCGGWSCAWYERSDPQRRTGEAVLAGVVTIDHDLHFSYETGMGTIQPDDYHVAHGEPMSSEKFEAFKRVHFAALPDTSAWDQLSPWERSEISRLYGWGRGNPERVTLKVSFRNRMTWYGTRGWLHRSDDSPWPARPHPVRPVSALRRAQARVQPVRVMQLLGLRAHHLGARLS